MAQVKRALGKGKDKGKALGKASPQAEEKSDDSSHPLQTEVLLALETIQAEWPKLGSMKPNKLGSGGQLSPFNCTDFKLQINDTGVHHCGGNLAWLDVLHSATPGVMPSRTAITNYIDHYFRNGISPMKHEFVVAVVDDSNPLDAMPLKRISPEEPHWALLIWICEALTGAKGDRAKKQSLLAVLPST